MAVLNLDVSFKYALDDFPMFVRYRTTGTPPPPPPAPDTPEIPTVVATGDTTITNVQYRVDAPVDAGNWDGWQYRWSNSTSFVSTDFTTADHVFTLSRDDIYTLETRIKYGTLYTAWSPTTTVIVPAYVAPAPATPSAPTVTATGATTSTSRQYEITAPAGHDTWDGWQFRFRIGGGSWGPDNPADRTTDSANWFTLNRGVSR